MDILVAILAAVIGLLACFAGYRFFLILLPIWGFFAGLWLGFTGIQTIFGEGFLANVSGVVVGLVVGVIFAVLSYLFYFVGVALLGATIGYGVTTGLIIGLFNISDPGALVVILGLAGAVVFAGAILLLNVQKYVVIIITALGGASAVFGGVALLFNVIEPEQFDKKIGVFAPVSFSENWFLWLVWAVLAVAGIVAQIQMNRSYVMEPPPASRI